MSVTVEKDLNLTGVAIPSRLRGFASSLLSAMMSNVLAATYPEKISAVSLYSGVAAGCFVAASGGVDTWNSTCANGQSTATADAWGNIARAMDPGYNGTRPRMQIWHGSVDTTVYPQNYQEGRICRCASCFFRLQWAG